MKRILTIIFLLIGAILLSPTAVNAADTLFYIRDGATGTYATTQCDSWASDRACDDLPATLVRGTTGATYYIADGSYEGYNFTNTTAPLDGTKILTIKKATVADHGTATGWDNAYGDGQAVFQYSDAGSVSGPSAIKLNTFRIYKTYYITIDGAVGSGSNPDNYGFKLVMAPCFGGAAEGCPTLTYWNAILMGNSNTKKENWFGITIRHIAAQGPYETKEYACFQNKTCTSQGITTYFMRSGGGSLNGLEISSSLITGWVNNINIMGSVDVVIKDNYMGHNYCFKAATADHDQNLNLDGNDNVLIYNNTFYKSHSFAVAFHQQSGSNSNISIYNNLFYGENEVQEPATATMSGFISTMTSDTNTLNGNLYVHHNTVVDQHCGGKGFVRIGTITNSSMAYVYNNLIYNSTSCSTANTGYTSGVIEHDYNAYLSTTGNTAETHGQVDPEAESPFNTGVYTISTTWDAAQVSEEKASLIGKGKTLASPFTTDRAGVERTAPFDIGAYDVGGSADATAPTLAEVTPVPASSSNQAPSYVFSSDEAGTVTYGGTCGNGSLSTAIVGNNTTQWNLGVGTYSNCTITVTDAASNASTPLAVTEFIITPVDSAAAKTIEGGVVFTTLP
jgi:hypothetical protein